MRAIRSNSSSLGQSRSELTTSTQTNNCLKHMLSVKVTRDSHAIATYRRRQQTLCSHRGGSGPICPPLLLSDQAPSLRRTPGIPLSRSGPERDLSTQPKQGVTPVLEPAAPSNVTHTPSQASTTMLSSTPCRAPHPNLQVRGWTNNTGPQRKAPRDPDASFLVCRCYI